MAYLLNFFRHYIYDLRSLNIVLFAFIPLSLLFSRTISEIIVCFICFSFLYTIVQRGQWRDLITGWVGILLMIWVLLNLFVSPQAISPETSFTRSLLWIRFVLLFAATTLWLVRSVDDLKIVGALWLLTLGGAMLDGFVQFFTDISLSGQDRPGDRLTGPLDRPNIGNFVTRLGFPVVVMAVLVGQNAAWSARRWVALALCGAVAYVFIILTGERSAIMLTCIAVFSILGFSVVFVPSWRMRAFWTMFSALLVLTGLFWSSHAVSRRMELFVTDVSDFWSSIYGQLFEAGLRIWIENPITGVGLKGFREFEWSAEQAHLQGDLRGYLHPHNIYIEWLCETGLVGFVGFMIFVVALVIPVIRVIAAGPDRRLVGLLLAGGVIVLLFPVAATQSFFSNWPALLFWSALSSIAALTQVVLSDSHSRTASTDHIKTA